MKNIIRIGADIGGSHITAALVDVKADKILEESICKGPVNSQGSSEEIISQWTAVIKQVIDNNPQISIDAIGLAMPGPFDYPNGIALLKGVAKYESLYGLNIRQILKEYLNFSGEIYFENDAACFGLGESWTGGGKGYNKLIAITLGTGFGATFIENHTVLTSGEGVPEGGELWNSPFKDTIAEDFISTRWLVNIFNATTSHKVTGVKEIYDLAMEGDKEATDLLITFGENLGECLAPWIKSFNAEILIVGGNIRKAGPAFLPAAMKVLEKHGISIKTHIAESGERAAISGAAYVCDNYINQPAI